MNYKGKFVNLENPSKYVGDVNNITYRSMWERNAMRWCDLNPVIKEWASEEIAIPYNNPIKGKAKYYPDLFLVFADGTMKLIEIKPRVQTEPPAQPKKKTQRFLTEVATYAINQEKWKAAREFCLINNITFEVWTEDTLKQIGIPTAANTKTDIKPVSKKPQFKKTYTKPKRRS